MVLVIMIISAVGDLLVLIALIVAVKALNIVNGACAEAITADQAALEARLQAADREIESVRFASESLGQACAAARGLIKREREVVERSKG